MSQITIMRTDRAWPVLNIALIALKDFLFGVVDGFNRDDKKAWRRIWARIKGMEAGEMLVIDIRMPRSGAYHRRHMCIEQSVFDAQERFQSFEQFRVWLKVGAGWVDWCAGPKGGVVPIPKSISYSNADQEEFAKYHDAVVDFLRGPHAARFLWRHLSESGADDMMNAILEGFDE
jgi:hypothetical protein